MVAYHFKGGNVGSSPAPKKVVLAFLFTNLSKNVIINYGSNKKVFCPRGAELTTRKGKKAFLFSRINFFAPC